MEILRSKDSPAVDNKPKKNAPNAFVPQKNEYRTDTKKKIRYYQNFDYPIYLNRKNDNFETPKFINGQEVKFKSNLEGDEIKWKRMSTIPKYSDQVVLLGEPLGHRNYFRAFTNNISVPKLVKENRLDTLLPHRPKKTVRLYGVTPLVLLGKGKTSSPVQKWKEKVKKGRPGIKEPTRRIYGPEIAPNMADIGEFCFID